MHAPPPPTALYEYLRSLVDIANNSSQAYPQFALVEAYWHIGRIIVETEQAGTERADYGIHLIEQLSQQLTDTFGKGYSLANMWRFKQFYLAFQILSTKGRELPNLREHLRIELSWSHYRILMKLKNLAERHFYLNLAADERWNVRLLQKLVKSGYYRQVALGDDQLLARPAPKRLLANDSSPTPSIITGANRSRLATIKKILLDRYVGWAFVAQRQYISVAGQDQWVELVFFQVILQRFVLIQLGEPDPATRAQFIQLLDAYVYKQPPGISNLPIGLIVGKKVMHLTTSSEPSLSIEELSCLPESFL